MRLPKPCLDCGQPTDGGSRCRLHANQYSSRAYDGSWRQLSKQKRAAVGCCQCLGCTLHRGFCGSVERLSLDHSVPVALGGSARHGTVVLCQRCNSAKRDRI